MNLLSKFRHSKLLQNVVTLYGVQACTYLLPLMTLPYLARVLGPGGWGAVVFSQSIGALIVIAVEYGFELAATREVSRHREDRAYLAELIAGVLGAKLFLAVIAVSVAILLRPWTMRIAPSPALFWSSVVWGVAQGINMLWYFQGMERMQVAGGLDISGKILATLSIFVFVHQPADGWKVMASQSIGCAVSHAITVFTAYREVGFRRPSFSSIQKALRLSWQLFLFRASQSMLSVANGLILGFFAPASAVGLYAGADKIAQVARQGLWPVSQALFPRQSQKIQEDQRHAAKLLRMSMWFLGGLSSAFGLLMFFGAPLIVELALGAAYLPAIPTLRAFAVLIPLIALSTVLCFQWFLPLGLDGPFNRIILLAGIINVTVGLLLAPRLSHLGMALAQITQQAFTLFAMDFVLRRKSLSPFRPLATIAETELVGVVS